MPPAVNLNTHQLEDKSPLTVTATLPGHWDNGQQATILPAPWIWSAKRKISTELVETSSGKVMCSPFSMYGGVWVNMGSYHVYSPFPELGGRVGRIMVWMLGILRFPLHPASYRTGKLNNASSPTIRESYRWRVSFLPSKPIHVFIT